MKSVIWPGQGIVGAVEGKNRTSIVHLDWRKSTSSASLSRSLRFSPSALKTPVPKRDLMYSLNTEPFSKCSKSVASILWEISRLA